MLEKLHVYMQKLPEPQNLNKNELKWIMNLNITHKPIKLLEENIRENLHELGFDNKSDLRWASKTIL